jgi:hypothetical protein
MKAKEMRGQYGTIIRYSGNTWDEYKKTTLLYKP